ncbi:ycf3-interacting protein 1, chloroplastic [Corylus avellana]|uniref:ycf3-interacting protein 1, chloroplastic n=1 Tax=Corylus avellana TaxID=13451 RepID=UPI00286B1A0A|nr:ycf3-interacting protein 1, chloroplastic [Corylus avellana]
MALPLLQLPLAASSPYSSSSSSSSSCCCFPTLPFVFQLHHRRPPLHYRRDRGLKRSGVVVLVSKEEATSTQEDEQQQDEYEEPPDPQDLEYVRQIKRVLELLRKNRDMIFSEVKLTIMIEDPREVERRRLLGIEDPDTPTRDDLGAALEEVNEGKVPKNRVALQMLAEEMSQWPNLEVEVKKSKARKSLYAKATDTGVDPKVAAKRLNIDWDSAAEIEDTDDKDDTEVPAAVGYGALYLVTAFPVIIGISVVLILFYNSLQ